MRFTPLSQLLSELQWVISEIKRLKPFAHTEYTKITDLNIRKTSLTGKIRNHGKHYDIVKVSFIAQAKKVGDTNAATMITTKVLGPEENFITYYSNVHKDDFPHLLTIHFPNHQIKNFNLEIIEPGKLLEK